MTMRRYTVQHILMVCCIVGIDMITKVLAVAYCACPLHIMPGIACSLVYNTGVVWGIASSVSWLYTLVSVVQMMLVGLLTIYAGIRIWRGNSAWGEICIIAGGLGNVITRAVYDGVVDFIVIGYGPYVWPAFNIADIAIVVGVAILLWKSQG